MAAERVALAGAFASAARSYWLSVFPRVSRELCGWRARALTMPNPVLRARALEALAKRGNMEGAAAFATFAPSRHRADAVRAAVAFQAAYNYLDVLAEHSGEEVMRDSHRLHQALVAALDPAAPHIDYYEHHHHRGDGGYLEAMVEACRAGLLTLPSYETVAPAARRAAERVRVFQSFNSGVAQGDHGELERWGCAQTPSGTSLRWWETAASGGSSLGVHVMIAAAAERSLEPGQVTALENAYFPWIGALHSMLDHLVDVAEDARTGQRSLMTYYRTSEEAAEGMRLLAERSLQCARNLNPGRRHELIVAAMASFYLSAPAARAPETLPVSEAVLEAIGGLARPALAMFKARETASRVYYPSRQRAHDDAAETLAFA
jgi:tetraprenyl-beta-curcumene synthase